MVVQEHPAWPRIVYDLQPVDQMLTDYLDSIPALTPDTFDPDELALLGAHTLGQSREEMQDSLQLDHEELQGMYSKVYHKMDVRPEQDLTVAYRACASGLVPYEREMWRRPDPLPIHTAIIFKARIGGYTTSQIGGELLPGGGKRMVANARQEINRYFDTKNVVHAVLRAFESGLLARDV